MTAREEISRHEFTSIIPQNTPTSCWPGVAFGSPIRSKKEPTIRRRKPPNKYFFMRRPWSRDKKREFVENVLTCFKLLVQKLEREEGIFFRSPKNGVVPPPPNPPTRNRKFHGPVRRTQREAVASVFLDPICKRDRENIGRSCKIAYLRPYCTRDGTMSEQVIGTFFGNEATWAERIIGKITSHPINITHQPAVRCHPNEHSYTLLNGKLPYYLPLYRIGFW
ncbi:hypothetical protein RND81_14G191400 [Saponaria officinalis]|uniref:Uncharacterized protein n=1 Tax=Saponaria officinalis TaxID=3572 RepID=A0AAW1GS55_SAPOF